MRWIIWPPLLLAVVVVGTGGGVALETVSEDDKNFIATQFSRCWDFYARDKAVSSPIVMVRVALSSDGNVIQAARVDDPRYYSDRYFRAASDNAVRAVNNCSPIKLPEGKFGAMKDLLLTFDPMTSDRNALPAILDTFSAIMDWFRSGDTE